MPTANHDTITPTRRSALGFSLAAVAASLTVPAIAGPATAEDTPLARLNRRFHELAEVWEKADRLECALPDGPAAEAAAASCSAALVTILDLQDEAAGLLAQTPQDSALLALFAYYRMESLTIDEDDAPDHRAIMTLLASVVVSLGRIGAFDIDRLGWGDTRSLRSFRPLVGSAVA